MPEINYYCSIINDTITASYSAQQIPVLNKGNCEGSKYIDECSHSEECCVSTINCPLFKELNNL